MRRKTTDLLDVFRVRPAPSGGSEGEGKVIKSSASKPARAPFEGVALSPRQMLLGGCVMVLLLVLSFTVGIGVGKSGGSSGATPSLQRDASIGVVIRGRVPRMDPLRQRENTPKAMKKVLVDFGIPESLVEAKVEGESILLVVGPFRDRDEAWRFYAAKGLKVLRPGGGAPFKDPAFAQGPAPR
jgi:hypothetical protein